PVQVPSTVEVVGQAQSETAAQILLESQVRLLRVGVNKVLGLRIAEGLKRQREERRRIQVVLVHEEKGIRRGVSRKGRGIKPLPAGLIPRNGGQAVRRVQNPLKNVGSV